MEPKTPQRLHGTQMSPFSAKSGSHCGGQKDAEPPQTGPLTALSCQRTNIPNSELQHKRVVGPELVSHSREIKEAVPSWSNIGLCVLQCRRPGTDEHPIPAPNDGQRPLSEYVAQPRQTHSSGDPSTSTMRSRAGDVLTSHFSVVPLESRCD